MGYRKYHETDCPTCRHATDMLLQLRLSMLALFTKAMQASVLTFS